MKLSKMKPAGSALHGFKLTPSKVNVNVLASYAAQLRTKVGK